MCLAYGIHSLDVLLNIIAENNMFMLFEAVDKVRKQPDYRICRLIAHLPVCVAGVVVPRLSETCRAVRTGSH